MHSATVILLSEQTPHCSWSRAAEEEGALVLLTGGLAEDVLVPFSARRENGWTSALVIRERGAGLNLSACRESGRRELMTNYTRLPADLPGARLSSSERDVVRGLLGNRRLSALFAEVFAIRRRLNNDWTSWESDPLCGMRPCVIWPFNYHSIIQSDTGGSVAAFSLFQGGYILFFITNHYSVMHPYQ